MIIIINKCENWNFGNWKLENWNFGNWDLNLKIGILKNYLEMEFLKINK